MKTREKQPKDGNSPSAIGHGWHRYLSWLEALISARMKEYFESEEREYSVADLLADCPRPKNGTPFEDTIARHGLTGDEVLVLCLAMAPVLRPQVLDIFFTKNPLYDRPFVEFGGIRSEHSQGFTPTVGTALFLLCGNDLELQVTKRNLFAPDHRLLRLQLLRLDAAPNAVGESAQILAVPSEHQGYFISGTYPKPQFSPQFPARLLETKLDWEDLVLEKEAMAALLEIQSWLLHQTELMEDWGLGRMLKPGYRSLFYGPPGTGKTLAATLLGKLTERDVYRIDLSMVVSKYIGETEKNLGSVFDQALEKQWILFFDEADALFGKRTSVSSSNDRHANQEVSYLLQRVEDFPGTVILASNFKNNIDEAFLRRFQSVVQFQKPDRHQRLRLWQLAFDNNVPRTGNLDLRSIADKYELTGGEIVNVIRHAALIAIASKDRKVNMEGILSGVRKEFLKDGRMLDPEMD